MSRRIRAENESTNTISNNVVVFLVSFLFCEIHLLACVEKTQLLLRLKNFKLDALHSVIQDVFNFDMRFKRDYRLQMN